MMGFKAFHSAEATIAGIELHRITSNVEERSTGYCGK